MGFTIRRSLPSITGLLALLLIIGVAAVIFAGAPVWFPAVFAIAVIGLQYAINPLIIQWLVPATVIDNDGQRYLTEHPVGELVARRCRDAGVPLVKLGIVDDGNPNAFTFGRTPSDARMWITRGLLERLDERELDAVAAAFASGIDPTRAVAAMRWEVVNPWGRTLEKLSSHPLVARRIEALEKVSPGAPMHWSVLKATATVPPSEAAAVRRSFWGQFAIAVAPWIILAVAVLGGVLHSVFSVGLAVAVAGCLFLLKQRIRYPTTFEAVDEVTSLLERIDASPVAGIGVNVKGRIIGRGMPGYVLSPDLVVQDESGFVPLLYRQPLPLWGSLFALFRADKYFGQEVMAQGWYRRLPGPAVELRGVIAADGTHTRTYTWVTRYVASGLVLLAGLIVMAVGLAGA